MTLQYYLLWNTSKTDERPFTLNLMTVFTQCVLVAAEYARLIRICTLSRVRLKVRSKLRLIDPTFKFSRGLL